MKFCIDTKTFARTLGLAASVVPARHPNHIMTSIRLHSDGKGKPLSVESCCGDIYFRASVTACDVSEGGACMVQAAILRQTVGQLSSITANCSTSDAGLRIDGNFTSTIRDISEGEFPSIGDGPCVARSFKANELCSVLRSVMMVAPRSDGSRYAPPGVMVSYSGSQVDIAATEGHMLVWQHLRVAKGEQASGVIPTKSAQVIMNAIEDAGDDSECTLGIGPQCFVFTSEQIEVRGALWEGVPVPYRDLVTNPGDNSITFNAREMCEALDESRLYTSEMACGVLIQPCGGTVKIVAETADVGRYVRAIVAETKGSPEPVFINPRHLAAVIKASGDNSVTLIQESNTKPQQIRSSDGRCRCFAMPIDPKVVSAPSPEK